MTEGTKNVELQPNQIKSRSNLQAGTMAEVVWKEQPFRGFGGIHQEKDGNEDMMRRKQMVEIREQKTQNRISSWTEW